MTKMKRVVVALITVLSTLAMTSAGLATTAPPAGASCAPYTVTAQDNSTWTVPCDQTKPALTTGISGIATVGAPPGVQLTNGVGPGGIYTAYCLYDGVPAGRGITSDLDPHFGLLLEFSLKWDCNISVDYTLEISQMTTLTKWKSGNWLPIPYESYVSTAGWQNFTAGTYHVIWYAPAQFYSCLPQNGIASFRMFTTVALMTVQNSNIRNIGLWGPYSNWYSSYNENCYH